MADDTLQQAIGLVKAGKDSEARGLLYHLVKTNPHNEMAWLWLTETMTESQRLTTLAQALKFNPDSQKIQHALSRLRAKEEQAVPKLPHPPKDEPRPVPPIPTSAVDRSMMQTARLTFLPEDDTAGQPDRSQVQTAQLPALPSQIDRSVMKAARYNISPDTLAPDKLPPELQLPGKPASSPAPKRADQTEIKTSQLAFAPDEPVGKPVLQSPQSPTFKSAPAPVPALPQDKIDRSLLKSARFEKAEPLKTGPLHVPPPPSAPGPVGTGSLKAPPPLSEPSPVSTGSLKVPPPTSMQVSQRPASTGSLGAAAGVTAQAVTPPVPTLPPAKPPAKAVDEPTFGVKQQMDALLSEPHPSPDPVQKPQKGSAPPPPTFPPAREETIEPKRKPRRRLSGLEIFLIIIAVLLVLSIAGFLAWDFFGPEPATPTPAVLPPPVYLATSTLPPTNTPQATSTPIPPPTLRPTFTLLVSPTPTLNPDSPSVLFFDPGSCAVRQVSASGGASQFMAESVPANCLAPELSLDGLRYAYQRQTLGAESANSLYVANVNGSSQTTLIGQGESPIWEVDWAPDSTWLSYTAQVGTNEGKPVIGIYLLRADGTNQVQLTDGEIPSIIPDSKTAVSWSPDGQWIAFYADNRPTIIRPDGTGLEKLSEDAGLSVIAWSPDSRQIAFYSSDLNNPGIVVVEIDGRRSFVDSNALKVPVSGDALLWSPDGRRFAAYDIAQKALVLVSRDGTQVETLTSVGGIPTRLAWSPDGSQLAYIELSQEDSPIGALKVVNLDGTGQTILATSAANEPIRWKLPADFTGESTPAPVINVPTPTPEP